MYWTTARRVRPTLGAKGVRVGAGIEVPVGKLVAVSVGVFVGVTVGVIVGGVADGAESVGFAVNVGVENGVAELAGVAWAAARVAGMWGR